MLLNVIKDLQPDFDKISLCIKDSFESNYHLLIYERQKVGIKILKNPKALIDYSQTVDDAYGNLENYNPTKKRRVLIVSDDMIADMESNKKLIPAVTELFLRRRKFSISLVFISQTYFKIKLQQIASNHSSKIDFKDVMKVYKDYTKEPYLFSLNDTTLSLDNQLQFRKNLLKKWVLLRTLKW